MPAVLITADGGDGEGVSGQCVDFGGRELGIEIEDVGAIGPFDVAVVSGSDGDGVVGIEVVPCDEACGVERRRAIELNGGAGLCDGGDFRLVVGASEGDGDDFGRSGGVIACAGVIAGDDVEGEGESFVLA